MEDLINYTEETWRAPSNKTSGSELTRPYPAHFRGGFDPLKSTVGSDFALKHVFATKDPVQKCNMLAIREASTVRPLLSTQHMQLVDRIERLTIDGHLFLESDVM